MLELRGPRGETTEVEVEVPPEGTSVGFDFEVLDVDGFLEGIGAPASVADTETPRAPRAPAD